MWKAYVRGEKDVGWFVERAKRTGTGFVPFRFVLFESILFIKNKKKNQKKKEWRINERTVFNNGIHQIFIRDTIYSKKEREREKEEKRKK